MPVSASKVGEWYLDDSDSSEVLMSVGAGGTSKLQRYEHYVIAISRDLVKVTRHVEEVGTEASSFYVRTGGGAMMSFSSRKADGAFRKYRCTNDRLSPEDPITGVCRQTQVWERMTQIVDMTGTEWPA